VRMFPRVEHIFEKVNDAGYHNLCASGVGESVCVGVA
jgi:hypothetical protein